MAAVIAALNIAGWGIFVLTVLPHHFRYDKLGVGLGVAITAWKHRVPLGHPQCPEAPEALGGIPRSCR
jgi:hypothetical protein